MYGRDGERDLNFAVSQAMLLASGGRMPEDSSTWRTRLLSALLLILSAVTVGVAWLVGGTEVAIIAAVLCLAVLVGCSLAIGWRSGRGPRPSATAVSPDRES